VTQIPPIQQVRPRLGAIFEVPATHTIRAVSTLLWLRFFSSHVKKSPVRGSFPRYRQRRPRYIRAARLEPDTSSPTTTGDDTAVLQM
ncbi:Hypothetical predicted protein, partial [Pelobates cultripes]